MPEVADIVGLHGEAYRQKFGHVLTSAQKQALQDIQHCRTPFFGGHVHQCGHCGGEIYSYHSCRNRSCPKCHHNQTERWLAAQRQRLPACSYYLMTFTLPAQLHAIARSHPKKVYSLLMRAAADALQKLARDPRYLGARIGALAVLHTWTRAMLFHPHVHMLVTAGGMSFDSSRWIEPGNPAFLVPVRALSILFRAKLCAALRKADLLRFVPAAVWKKSWVVHSQHAGSGQKVLDYLGRYVFRIAISNSRIDSIDNGNVGFHYRDNRTQQTRHVTLSGEEFLRRFLQHVLPRGSMKVRHYGILSPRYRSCLDAIPAAGSPARVPLTVSDSPAAPVASQLRCPLCHIGLLTSVGRLVAVRNHSP
jgi:Putative transposase/Transposase zinc-binding domain